MKNENKGVEAQCSVVGSYCGDDLCRRSGFFRGSIYVSNHQHMTVRAEYSIEVWNEGKTALVESIEWGEFANLNEAKETILWIKNVGNKDIRYSWNATSVPTQFSITNQWWEDGDLEWLDLDQDTLCGYLMFPTNELKIKFTLNCTEFKAGSYDFTLNIMSNDPY